MYGHLCRWDRAKTLHGSVFALCAGFDSGRLRRSTGFNSDGENSQGIACGVDWRGRTSQTRELQTKGEVQGESTRNAVDRGASSLGKVEQVDIFSNPTKALRKSPWAREWDRPGTRRIGPDFEARLSIALGIRSVSLDIGSAIDLGRATSSQPYQALSLVGGLGRLPPLRIRATTTPPPRL
jgi:hypothetical protein